MHMLRTSQTGEAFGQQVLNEVNAIQLSPAITELPRGFFMLYNHLRCQLPTV